MVSIVLKSWPAFLIGFALIAFSVSAVAADGEFDADVLQKLLGKSGKASNVKIKPIKKNDALRLTSNRNQIIRLNQDAASVIVNNPVHAAVMLDSPRLLIVMPRAPGATSFSVLDSAGNIILQKEIIVTNVQPKYVRVRRMCAGGDSSCVPTAYFYCPDGCYEVTAVGDTGGGGNVPAPTVSNAGGRGGDGGQLEAPQNPVQTTTAPATYPGTSP